MHYDVDVGVSPDESLMRVQYGAPWCHSVRVSLLRRPVVRLRHCGTVSLGSVQMVEQSKRYVPEAISMLLGLLASSLPEEALAQTPEATEVRLNPPVFFSSLFR